MTKAVLPLVEGVEFPNQFRISLEKKRDFICELPRCEDGRDLSKTQYVNLGRISHEYRNRRGAYVYLWMASFRDNLSSHYLGSIPLCLEIEENPQDKFYWFGIHMPPGLSGLNATLLFNEEAKPVSKILLHRGAIARLVLLDQHRRYPGWHYANPTVALHFISRGKAEPVKGIVEGTDW